MAIAVGSTEVQDPLAPEGYSDEEGQILGAMGWTDELMAKFSRSAVRYGADIVLALVAKAMGTTNLDQLPAKVAALVQDGFSREISQARNLVTDLASNQEFIAAVVAKVTERGDERSRRSRETRENIIRPGVAQWANSQRQAAQGEAYKTEDDVVPDEVNQRLVAILDATDGPLYRKPYAQYPGLIASALNTKAEAMAKAITGLVKTASRKKVDAAAAARQFVLLGLDPSDSAAVRQKLEADQEFKGHLK